MDYKEIKNLIDRTLQGKNLNHSITPAEHQTMLTALLDYIQSLRVTGQSIVQGYAKDDTFPATPDNGRLCYIALCPSGMTTSFIEFNDREGNPISVSCPQDKIMFAAFLWNTKYWSKILRGIGIDVDTLNGDFNNDFNNDFSIK